MGNQHNLACPKCLSPHGLYIMTEITVEGLLLEDGVDFDCGGDFYFGDDNGVRCGCGWRGLVGQLVELQPSDEGYFSEGEDEDVE